MRTYVDMFAKFRLLKKDADGKFKPLRKNDVSDLSVGGFLFEIGEKSVPFDFKATAVHFEEDVLRMSMQNSVLRQVILLHPCWRPQRESKISM